MTLEQTFSSLKSKGQTGFFPFVTAGFTSLEFTKQLLVRLSDGLADGFEIGIPYSDPLADGPTIQYASEWALKQGVQTDQVMTALSEVSESINPAIFMTYYNVVFKYGLKRFAVAAKKAGAAGLIIPDLAVEESGPWVETAACEGLATIFMVAPTSSDDRIKRIVEVSTGFIYCVSLTGVTGARAQLSGTLPELIGRIKALTDKPIVVGFGVSTGEQAAALRGLADGIIVGSAMVNAIRSGTDDQARIENAVSLATEIMTALDRI